MIGSGTFSLHLGPGQAVASLLIAAFTILNCFGVGRTAKVQNVLTSTKLLVIVGFVLAAFLFGSGDWGHFSQHAVRTSSTGLPMQFVISLIWVMFGYSGWNAATYVAEEIRRPERTLPWRAGRRRRAGRGPLSGPQPGVHLARRSANADKQGKAKSRWATWPLPTCSGRA